MTRFFSLIGAKIAGLLMALAAVFSLPTAPTPIEPPQNLAVQGSTSPQEIATTSAPDMSANSSASAASAKTASSPASATSTPAAPEAYFPPGVDDALVKSSVVNIVCISNDDNLPSMTASGVVIDPRGVILTNAHAAQYFLLTDYMEDGRLQCVIRTGNPARTQYEAELLYLPPAWVENNHSSIFAGGASKGSGRDDFALLRISQSVSGEGVPKEIPFLPYSVDSKLHNDDPVVLAAYPAEFIPVENISSSLYDVSLAAKVEKVLTFDDNTVDLVSVPGSYLAQRGSSGGPLVNEKGQLAGLITTESSSAENGERNLYAITASYINREIKTYTGGGLADLLDGNISRKAVNFALHDAPALRAKLEASSTPSE